MRLLKVGCVQVRTHTNVNIRCLENKPMLNSRNEYIKKKNNKFFVHFGGQWTDRVLTFKIDLNKLRFLVFYSSTQQ